MLALTVTVFVFVETTGRPLFSFLPPVLALAF